MHVAYGDGLRSKDDAKRKRNDDIDHQLQTNGARRTLLRMQFRRLSRDVSELEARAQAMRDELKRHRADFDFVVNEIAELIGTKSDA